MICGMIRHSKMQWSSRNWWALESEFDLRNEHSTWPHIWLYPKEFDSSFVEFKVYARWDRLVGVVCGSEKWDGT